MQSDGLQVSSISFYPFTNINALTFDFFHFLHFVHIDFFQEKVCEALRRLAKIFLKKIFRYCEKVIFDVTFCLFSRQSKGASLGIEHTIFDPSPLHLGQRWVGDIFSETPEGGKTPLRGLYPLRCFTENVFIPSEATKRLATIRSSLASKPP